MCVAGENKPKFNYKSIFAHPHAYKSRWLNRRNPLATCHIHNSESMPHWQPTKQALCVYAPKTMHLVFHI